MPEVCTEYIPVDEGLPVRKGNYLCRLLDSRERPFYRVLTWCGKSFFSQLGMCKFSNVTHWGNVPTVEDEVGWDL